MRNLLPSRIDALFFVLAIPGIILAGAMQAGAWSFSGSGFVSSCSRPVTASSESLLGEHYSPEENLEAIDVDLIDHARQSIEIAMYAFTDRPIADAVIRAAARGVHVWIYRDEIQVKDRGDKMRRLMSSAPGQHGLISIEVKRNSSRNIMHLKAYEIDGKWLRTGSANWSPPGEGAWCSRGERLHRDQQDNNLFITNDSREVRRFESTFRRIWNRGSNRPWDESMSRRRSR
ncbi:MAG: phospholipase D-like domain-containing protein [Leptospirales bacterium]